MARNDNTGIIIVGIIVLGLIAYNSGLMSLFAPDPYKTCNLPAGGGSCAIDFILPAGQELNGYTLNMSFAKIASGYYLGAAPMTRVSGYSYDKRDSDGEGKTSIYDILKYPDAWPEEVYSANVTYTVTARAACSGRYDALTVRTGVGQLDDYPYDEFKICNTWDNSPTACPRYLVHDYIYPRTGEHFVDVMSVGAGDSVVQCQWDVVGQDLTETKTSSAVLNFNDLKSNSRAIQIYQWDIGGDYDGNGYLIAKSATATYQPAEYPTNLTIQIGSQKVPVGSGTLVNPTSSLDLSALVNSACDRPYNVNACNVTLQFNSLKGGIITIRDKESLRVSVQPEPPADELYVTCVNGTSYMKSDACVVVRGVWDCPAISANSDCLKVVVNQTVVQNQTQINQTAPVANNSVIQEPVVKKDYTIYFIIGGILLLLYLLIPRK